MGKTGWPMFTRAGEEDGPVGSSEPLNKGPHRFPPGSTDGRTLKVWDVQARMTSISVTTADRYVLAETREEAQELADKWIENNERIWEEKQCCDGDDIVAEVAELKPGKWPLDRPGYIFSRLVGHPALPERITHDPIDNDCPHWGMEDRNDV